MNPQKRFIASSVKAYETPTAMNYKEKLKDITTFIFDVYDSAQLYKTFTAESPDTYSGQIPPQAFSSNIKYFIRATNSSGRNGAPPLA